MAHINNDNNFDSSMVWASPQTKRSLAEMLSLPTSMKTLFGESDRLKEEANFTNHENTFSRAAGTKIRLHLLPAVV